MTQEYTTEESDALILQEMGLAEADSTINSNEVVDETEEEALEEEQETEEETTEDEEEQETEVNTSKPKKGIAKILHQKNEFKKQAEAERTRAEILQAELDRITEEGNYGSEEYVQTLVDKRMAESEERNEFFEINEELKSYKKDILQYSRETGLSLDKASKLYLAENAPELLLDKETRNKQKSKLYSTPAITSKRVTTKSEYKYTDEEFDRLYKEGVIKF